jgi:hypothetical protein
VDLSTQLAFLDETLLARVATQFPDALNDAERAAVSAYLVLAHACVEEYIEDAFRLHFGSVMNMARWPLVPMAVGEALLAVGLSLPEAKRAPYRSRTLIGMTKAGSTHYEHVVVGANHGIRTGNLKKLAEGCGVNWQEFEAVLSSRLADLDTLGAKRGEAGHLSPFSSKQLAVSAQAYPDDVRGWVEAGRDAAVAVRAYLSEVVDGQFRSLYALTGR